MSRRLFVVSLCTIAAVALAAPAAQASAPYVTHYKDLPANYTDDSLCHFDGYAFDVTVNGSDHVIIREYDTKTVFVTNCSGSLEGCGKTAGPYHAGMRWPHQSWREMHQSWILRIHW